MKIRAGSNALRTAVTVAGRATGRASVQPVLATLLLEAAGETLQITATDLTLRCATRVHCVVDEPGEVCLDAEKLETFLSALDKDAEVTLAVGKNERATLTAPGSQMRMTGLEAVYFPVMNGALDLSMQTEGSALKALIGSVAYAASRDKARTELAGVLVKAEDGVLALAAADGVRMARRSWEHPDGSGDTFDVIAPREALEAVAVTLKGDSTVELGVNVARNLITIKSPDVTWTLVAVAGSYPSLDAVLALAPVTTYALARSDMARACKLLLGVADVVQGKHQTYTVSRVLCTAVKAGLVFSAGVGSAEQSARVAIRGDREGPTHGPFCLDGTFLKSAVDQMTEPMLLEVLERRITFFRPAGEDRATCVHAVTQVALSADELARLESPW